MIIEVFGLPGAGKTTLTKQWEQMGWTRARFSSRPEIFSYFLKFCIFHPVRVLRLSWFMIIFSGSIQLLYLKAVNLLIYNLALWQKSRDIPRAILDQGPSQALLSLFEREQSSNTLAALIRALPRSDLILVLDTPDAVRTGRLEKRGRTPRTEFGPEAVKRLAQVAKRHFLSTLSVFEEMHIPHALYTAPPLPWEALMASISYITFARMPTEKAHGVSIAHMCSSFASLGKKVELVVPHRRNPITETVFAFYGVKENFIVREIPSFDLLGRKLASPFFFFLQRLLFLRAVAKNRIRPGIVYTRDPEIAFAFRKSHIVVYEAHRMPRGLWGALAARLVRDAVLVVCNSLGTEAAFRARGITKTHVAPNGFDQNLFEDIKSSRSELAFPEGFLALYVGSDQPWKGIDIFRSSSPFAPDVSFAVVGGKETKKTGNRIEVGKVPPSAVPKYLASADVLVLPNTTETSESILYTSPIKLFEYLAAGKPIIASDLPSIREILTEQTAYFVPPGDATALAQAVTTLQRDVVRRKSMAREAKKLSTQYTWEARTRSIDAVLQTLL